MPVILFLNLKGGDSIARSIAKYSASLRGRREDSRVPASGEQLPAEQAGRVGSHYEEAETIPLSGTSSGQQETSEVSQPQSATLRST